jgi:hypothetical protein
MRPQRFWSVHRLFLDAGAGLLDMLRAKFNLYDFSKRMRRTALDIAA